MAAPLRKEKLLNGSEGTGKQRRSTIHGGSGRRGGMKVA